MPRQLTQLPETEAFIPCEQLRFGHIVVQKTDRLWEIEGRQLQIERRHIPVMIFQCRRTCHGKVVVKRYVEPDLWKLPKHANI
jgi:hypothetical protein